MRSDDEHKEDEKGEANAVHCLRYPWSDWAADESFNNDEQQSPAVERGHGDEIDDCQIDRDDCHNREQTADTLHRCTPHDSGDAHWTRDLREICSQGENAREELPQADGGKFCRAPSELSAFDEGLADGERDDTDRRDLDTESVAARIVWHDTSYRYGGKR